uniref:Uncharacterized protein n=1 Tax=Oryza punctata TaxID=4537 RepID=A0A0E0JGB0_ORYPU
METPPAHAFGYQTPCPRLHAAGKRHRRQTQQRRRGYTVDQTMAAYTATARWLLEPTKPLQRTLNWPLHRPIRRTRHRRRRRQHGGTGPHRGGRDIVVADLTDEHKVSLGRRFWSFFQACPVVFRWLARLTMDDCLSGPDDIPTLVNTCKRLRLLELRHCDVVDDAVLEIDALAALDLIRVPKLRRVYCDTWIGDNPPVRFGYVPCLDNIAFGSECLFWQEPFVLSEWLSDARNLSILYLNFRGQKIWVKPEDPKLLSPIFNNLLCWHTCEACECEYGAEKTNVTWETSDFKHHNLSLLEMKGFEVEKRVMQYLRLVIQRAVCLKSICLLEKDPCMECDNVNKHRCLEFFLFFLFYLLKYL